MSTTITANQIKTGNLAPANTGIIPTQYAIDSATISGNLSFNVAYVNYMSIFIFNTDSTTGHDLIVTLTSPPDGKGAVITVTLTIPPSGTGVLPPFSKELAPGEQLVLTWSGTSTSGVAIPFASTPNPQV